jgi:hypothetical protein
MSYLNSPLKHSLSFLPPLIPGVVSVGIILAFTYMHTYFIVLYSPSYTFSPTPPSSHYCQS